MAIWPLQVAEMTTKSSLALLQKHLLGGYTVDMPLSNCHRWGHEYCFATWNVVLLVPKLRETVFMLEHTHTVLLQPLLSPQLLLLLCTLNGWCQGTGSSLLNSQLGNKNIEWGVIWQTLISTRKGIWLCKNFVPNTLGCRKTAILH